MITTNNVVNHELIGLQVTVVESSNHQIVGLLGEIVDETKYMFTIDTTKGLKMIPKENSNWKFLLDNKNSVIRGASLLRRSYERIGVRYD